MFLLAVGLCIWLGEKTNELSLILKPLLFATCGAYTGLLIGYLYLASNAKKNRFALWFLLTNSFLCSLILILTCILLGVGWTPVISADLVLWILLASSSALTVRFPVLLSQKELIKSVFGFTGQTEPHMRSLATMADQSTRQDSTASLVPPPAAHISADTEAGTNDI
ncbi:hypothetical protein F5882DRAFT_91862 [Hyaloscypha sp. PMI_1271]|nr:hypothetical protein F5882DRAFT_91862 [Hyaloscypha sp. PMI_1271]